MQKKEHPKQNIQKTTRDGQPHHHAPCILRFPFGATGILLIQTGATETQLARPPPQLTPTRVLLRRKARASARFEDEPPPKSQGIYLKATGTSK